MKTHENIQQVVYGRSMRLLQPVVPLLYQINPMVLCSHLTNSCLLIVHTRAASSYRSITCTDDRSTPRAPCRPGWALSGCWGWSASGSR